jgi:hypothetical protein
MALDPVVGSVVAVLGERLLVLGLGAVQLAALQQHGADAARDRTVRVVFGLALGVVLAVDGDPLLGHHAGRQPQPEAEEVRRNRVQFERAVRLRAMQEDRHRRDRQVRRDQREEQDLPPSGLGQALAQQAQGEFPSPREFVHSICLVSPPSAAARVL